jgi:hypothetical protein
MISEEEITSISMKQSIENKNERLAKEKGMIRLFTPNEEDILRKGLTEEINDEK